MVAGEAVGVQALEVVAAEVKEAGVKQGGDILGEVGCLERDRGEAPCPAKPDYEPRAVGEPLARGERA